MASNKNIVYITNDRKKQKYKDFSYSSRYTHRTKIIDNIKLGDIKTILNNKFKISNIDLQNIDFNNRIILSSKS